MKIRIKFQKQGTVRFIGHLDVMRYFQKVMRRAEVDIRYSEGFSPHQIMSFASPLSVGLISHAEYVDIDVNSSGNSTGMVRRLNEVSAEGLEVLSYRELPETAKNAMSLVAAADYTFWFKEGFAPEDGSSVEEFFGKFLTFCKNETIPFVKQTKKGERTVDFFLFCSATYFSPLGICCDQMYLYPVLSIFISIPHTPELLLPSCQCDKLLHFYQSYEGNLSGFCPVRSQRRCPHLHEAWFPHSAASGQIH